MLKERKRTRAIAKELKLQTQAEKKAQQLANKGTKVRQNNSKNKGKSKAITPSSSSESTDSDEELDDEESLLEIVAPTPARSRRNRHISLPKRYRN